MIAFGPVPSRRLGRSLGINNIPPKMCTYSCVYCQLGPTLELRHSRCEFYQPERILSETQHKVEGSAKVGEPVDYLSFVPDGEPTLDANLGRTIGSLRSLGIPVTTISLQALDFSYGPVGIAHPAGAWSGLLWPILTAHPPWPAG